MKYLKIIIISVIYTLSFEGLSYGQIKALKLRDDLEKKSAGWLAFGDIRGNLQPCGCDPRTDLGGVQRLVNFFTKERSFHKDLEIFNLGNAESPLLSKRNESYIVQSALRAIKPDANLVNVLEIKNPNLLVQLKDHKFVLTNAIGQFSKRHSIQTYIKTKHSFVVGLVSPLKSIKTHVLPISNTLLTAVNENLKREKQERDSILLFSGSDKDLVNVLKKVKFDYVIRSNNKPMDADFDHQEKEKPDSLSANLEEQFVRMVPLGALGVLRGRGLESSVAPDLKSLIGDTKCKSTIFGNSTIDSRCKQPSSQLEAGLITWLTTRYINKDVLKKEFSSLEKNKSIAFEKLAEVRKLDIADSEYVGAEACRGCHAEAYDAWSKSSHSKAIKTLQQVAADQDSECVECHVVGYKNKGGFANMKFSPHLANVQCENCHGPRKEHIKNPTKSSGKWQQQCQECHKGAHSPGFNYNEYWQRIKHGK